MEITAIINADFAGWSAAEYLRAERAVQRGIGSGTASLKAAWRADVARSLSGRMGNAMRADVYPKGQPSANAAGLVWTKAPNIIDAHERGVTIRSKDGFWLAIPLPGAGRGAGGRRITPGEWEAKTGRALRFVYRGGRSALLVDDGTVRRGARVMKRDGFSRAARGFRNRTVPIFALVPQVKLKKALNLMQLAQQVGASLPARIAGSFGG